MRLWPSAAVRCGDETLASFAASLVAGAFGAVSRKRRYEREAARRDQALEAAARVSRAGLPLTESSRRAEPSASLEALAGVDAELLGCTVRRLRGVRSEAEPTDKGFTA